MILTYLFQNGAGNYCVCIKQLVENNTARYCFIWTIELRKIDSL